MKLLGNEQGNLVLLEALDVLPGLLALLSLSLPLHLLLCFPLLHRLLNPLPTKQPNLSTGNAGG